MFTMARLCIQQLHKLMGQAAHYNAARARAFLARHVGEARERAADEVLNEDVLADAPVLADEKARAQALRKFKPADLTDGDGAESVTIPVEDETAPVPGQVQRQTFAAEALL